MENSVSPQTKTMSERMSTLTPKAVIISVTKTDIRDGIKGDSSHCPIMLAAQRVFKKEKVIHSAISITENEDVVLDFVRRFDAGEHVSPCKFKGLLITPLLGGYLIRGRPLR